MIQHLVVAGLYEHVEHEADAARHVRGERARAVDVLHRDAPQALEEVVVLAVVEEGGPGQVRHLLPARILTAQQHVTALVHVLHNQDYMYIIT